MKKHIDIIAILHIVFGILPILIFAILKLVFNQFSDYIEDPHAYEIINKVAVIFLLIVLIINIPGIIAGIGLLGRNNWARILTLIVSAFRVFSVPLGTALAVYSFIILLDKDIIKEFKLKVNEADKS